MHNRYVNDLSGEYPPETPRCGHLFYLGTDAGGASVSGRLCGLPVEPTTGETPRPPELPPSAPGTKEEQEEEARCFFHCERTPEQEAQVPARLERTVAQGAFLGEAQLTGAQLEGTCLAGAQLTGANLAGANLRGADLRGATLQGATLAGAVLERAHLQDAILTLADLPGVNLRQASLQGASLLGASLQGADLRRADLRGAWLPEVNLQYADLRHAYLGTTLETEQSGGKLTPRATDLSAADLRGALLAEARLGPEVRLEEVRWTDTAAERPVTGRLLRTWSRYALADERCRRSAAQWAAWCDGRWAIVHNAYGGDRRKFDSDYRYPATYTHCETLYRQLRLNYQTSGDYLTAGEFHVREMECKRAAMLREQPEGWLKRALWWLMYATCAYGERPTWTLGWALGVVVLFAFLHGWSGLLQNGRPVVGPGMAWPSWEGVGPWLTAAYFSVVTFTTLGYGDLQAGPGVGRLLAGLEALLGYVLLSLFLVCIVRKFSR